MHVPVGKPLFGDIEKEFVNDALNKSEISGFFGGYIPKFEKEFAEFCGTTDAVSVSSGTTALHLALRTLGIGKGDEVLTSTFTNMATFFSILYDGGIPVPIDSEPDTYNMDPRLLEAAITPKTKAIMVVHIYGHPADMDPIMEIARKHNLFVIEDAAEAHGAEYKGKKVGSIGDIGCFSFYANKIITTGEGGMLTMQKPEYAEKARSLKALAFGKKNKFMHEDIGYNYRLTNLQCAIGSAQMTRIDDILARKHVMAEYYTKAFADIPEFILPKEMPWAKNVYWMYNIVLQGSLEGKREALMTTLKERGVETRESFLPFNDQELFIKQGIAHQGESPVASYAGINGFYIPSGTDISEEELMYVSEQIHDVVGQLRA